MAAAPDGAFVCAGPYAAPSPPLPSAPPACAPGMPEASYLESLPTYPARGPAEDPMQHGPPGVPQHSSSTIEEQLDAGLRFFLSMRNPHGLYYDKLTFDGQKSPLSTSATGFGLVALAISVERRVLPRDAALRLALQTMRSLRGGGGFAIERSTNGFMVHWPNDNGAGSGELSTIDTALLTLGALFASNYFGDSELRSLAFSLATSVHWADGIVEAHEDSEGRPGMYLQIHRDGSGSGMTRIFNEYYLLAFCGAHVETKILREPGKAARFFRENLAQPPSLRREYAGRELLTDHPERFLPGFIVQYCFYMSGHFIRSSQYRELFTNAAEADTLFWACHPNVGGQGRQVWGCGAGAYPEHLAENPSDPYGYKATAVNENEALVYSAPIIAGFLPCLPEYAGMLEEWHQNCDACKHSLPSGEAVLWRASVKHPGWRAPSIELVDFSTMILGSAAHILGEDFFLQHAPSL